MERAMNLADAMFDSMVGSEEEESQDPFQPPEEVEGVAEDLRPAVLHQMTAFRPMTGHYNPYLRRCCNLPSRGQGVPGTEDSVRQRTPRAARVHGAFQQPSRPHAALPQ